MTDGALRTESWSGSDMLIDFMHRHELPSDRSYCGHDVPAACKYGNKIVT